jgi:hypothetical protein
MSGGGSGLFSFASAQDEFGFYVSCFRVFLLFFSSFDAFLAPASTTPTAYLDYLEIPDFDLNGAGVFQDSQSPGGSQFAASTGDVVDTRNGSQPSTGHITAPRRSLANEDDDFEDDDDPPRTPAKPRGEKKVKVVSIKDQGKVVEKKKSSDRKKKRDRSKNTPKTDGVGARQAKEHDDAGGEEKGKKRGKNMQKAAEVQNNEVEGEE